MIHRAEHKNNYTLVSRDLIRDTRLNSEALHIMIFALSCADAFEFSVDGLAYTLGINRRKVMDAVKLLKECGYISQSRRADKSGKFVGCVWDFYEEPTTVSKTTVWMNHSVDEPQCGKLTLIKDNTESISNTEYIRSIEKKETRGEFSHVLLTPSEYSKLIDKLGTELTEQYISTLDAYLEDHPRKHYASHYTTILNWQRKDEKKPKATTQPLKGSGNPFLDLLENMEADE